MSRINYPFFASSAFLSHVPKLLAYHTLPCNKTKHFLPLEMLLGTISIQWALTNGQSGSFQRAQNLFFCPGTSHPFSFVVCKAGSSTPPVVHKAIAPPDPTHEHGNDVCMELHMEFLHGIRPIKGPQDDGRCRVCRVWATLIGPAAYSNRSGCFPVLAFLWVYSPHETVFLLSFGIFGVISLSLFAFTLILQGWGLCLEQMTKSSALSHHTVNGH